MGVRVGVRVAVSVATLALVGLAGCAHAPAPTTKVSAPALDFTPPEPPSGYTPKALAFAPHDMVAAAHPLAVQAGVAMLAQGGSAVDAAIATQLVLNVVEPQSSGIGGGAFMLHFDAAQRRTLAYDGRETAPAAATPDQFLGADGKPLPFLQAVDGGLSVGTPGVLRMLELAHRAHGKLPWATLFAPAIALADQGFAVSPRLATSIAGSAARIRAQGGAVAAYFLNADGSPLAIGTWLRSPALAASLRAIASGGADAFYRGDIAQAMVQAVARHPTRPGRLTLADLGGYQAKVREPVCATYRVRFKVCGMPPPSSGGITTLQTLGLLQRLDVAALPPTSADAVHLVSEAYRLAYADRAKYIADPDWVSVPSAGLLDAGYLKARAQLIRPDRSLGVPTAGQPPGAALALGADASPNLPSTTHLSIVDRWGNAVAMTSSIENGFGSLQMVGGFLLNNQLTDFSFVPADAAGPVANRVAPGKRPRSSMAPTLIFNAHTGDLEAAIGSPGGSAIIQYVTKTVLGLVDWGLDIQQAINLPNFGAQTSAVTAMEQGSVLDTPALKAALVAKGHQVVATPAFTSGLHGVVFNGVRADGQPGLLARNPGQGLWAGGADPRREGEARGSR
jgi:gamma-glutamyltranspeptidase/glutathione hydrolase